MSILLAASGDDPETWRAALAPLLPDFDLDGAGWRVRPDLGDPADIVYALTWKPPPGCLVGLPNLRAILNLGAGVDALAGDATLSEPPLADLPLIRLIDPALTVGMSEYVLHWVLHFHRDFHRYAEMQRLGQWAYFEQVEPRARTVGLLGLGELGTDAGLKLAALGFDVAGWSRSPKRVDGITSFHGEAALADFLARTQILVCLLPLTEQTRGILNADLFAALPTGAYVINAARGPHLDDDALLAAMASGHIAAAALDVFHDEPLAEDHPFWTHPDVFLTPHIASTTLPSSAARAVAENIKRLERGEAPVGLEHI